MATDKLSRRYGNASSAPSIQLRPGPPPALPPRQIATSSPPPPYSVAEENDYNDAPVETNAGTATFSSNEKREQSISEQWRSADPRASSTQSLIPSERTREGRRTLLLIYIHGFMGNETSFQSFPAHVHNLVSITLAETHVVHTKIYPRYKSRKAIEYARDDFSKWLEPHEGDDTDVILLGHSMGGILSAEVALMKPYSPATRQPFRHKILGTISFDTPFLGMHPGVVISGIGSLFRPAPESPATKQTASNTAANTLSPGQTLSSINQEYPFPTESSLSLAPSMQSTQSGTPTLSTPSPDDPNYNQPFPNDVHIPERTGFQSVLHFINKHSDGLTSATKQYFMSHLEFGGCLADWQGLKYRYSTLRSLEDVDDLAEMHTHGYETPKRRVRFINYYTASTGRIKQPKAPKVPDGHMTDKDGNVHPIEVEMKDMSIDGSTLSAPTIAVEEASDGTVIPHTVETETEEAQEHHEEVNEDEEDYFEAMPMQHIDSMPIPDDEPLPTPILTSSTENDEVEPPPGQLTPTQSQVQQPQTSEPQLPPIPEPPVEPEPIDLSSYTDKDSRKLAEKEYKRVMKAYQQAVKDRESAIKDRRKLMEKREKKAKQEQEKQSKAEQKQRAKEEKEEEKRQALELKEKEKEKGKEKEKATTEAPPKPKRDKKFCLLPSDISGPKDVCWERVYMEGVDEVGAHCGLFFMGPQYEDLVGNVGHRIEEWVKEDATRRAVFELHHDLD